MTIEKQQENSPKFKEIERVSKQVKEELKRFNKEKFYEKNGEEIVYNMDTVKEYLWILKEKKTWKELISKNSSAVIMAVQIALYSKNYSFWSVDWILWERTKEAIRKFQADNNLPVDTYWRSMPSTINKLLEIISRKNQIEIPEEEKIEAEEIMENKENKNELEKSDEWTIIDEWTILEDKNDNNEKNETILDQNIIRPEIQELIASININWDRFEHITSLTKEEAIAISSKARWYYLNFSWIKEIDEDVFEELLKYKWWINIWINNLTPWLAKKLVETWKSITFTWLEKINQETYEELWKTIWTLRFKTLKEITPEGIWELVKKPWWDIYLEAVEEINPEIAEKIIQYPRDISLDWVKKIDKKTAEVLLNKKVWRISLKWLETPLDEDVLEWMIQIPMQNLTTNNNVVSQIYNYKKKKEREWKDLSQVVLDVIDRKISNDKLSKLTNISYDDAEILSKSWLYYLDLSWIKDITPEIFEKLLEYKWSINIWIENLTPELATKLKESWKWISFSWLENINQETYQILWETKWFLRFKTLKEITPEGIWELVKKPWWDIYLEAVEEINPEIAEKIIQYPRDISLDWVKKIDKKTAEVLLNKKVWRISLKWLETPLDEDVLEWMIQIPMQNLTTNNNVVSQIYNYKKKKEKSEN